MLGKRGGGHPYYKNHNQYLMKTKFESKFTAASDRPPSHLKFESSDEEEDNGSSCNLMMAKLLKHMDEEKKSKVKVKEENKERLLQRRNMSEISFQHKVELFRGIPKNLSFAIHQIN